MVRHRSNRTRKWYKCYCFLFLWPLVTISYVLSSFWCMERNCDNFVKAVHEASVKKIVDSFFEDIIQRPLPVHDRVVNLTSDIQLDDDNTPINNNNSLYNAEGYTEWSRGKPDYRFISRMQTVADAMDHRLKSQLLQTIRTANRTRAEKEAVLDMVEDVAEIKEAMSHELNLLKLHLAARHRADDQGDWQRAQTAMEHVYQQLVWLQNPANCGRTKKLVCDLNKSCGFGCQLHHAVYCLVVSYALNRVLIVEDTTWSYAPSGWRRFFLPWSATCQDHWAMRPDAYRGKIGDWEQSSQTSEYLHCTLIDLLVRRADFLPPAVPSHVGKLIQEMHRQPFVWWVGQLVRYLMRPSKQMKALVEKIMADIGFYGPIVGVHIRRTDKLLKEGSYFAVRSYFKYAEEYFRQLKESGVNVTSRVFLATDDSEALMEALESYPDIDILYIQEHIESAERSARYNEQSLEYLLIDIYLLANTDFLVCTMSSQICRLAYELMQSYWVDASIRIISLDQNYYFGGQNPGLYQATSDYLPPDEDGLRLRAGDEIRVKESKGGHGMRHGFNTRTGYLGWFPEYKTHEVPKFVNFGP